MGDKLQPASLRDLSLLYLRLGTTAFGGPAAHIAMMEDEVVRRRRWLTREQFLDLLGAVSYTHLDVYKRQDEGDGNRSASNQIGEEIGDLKCGDVGVGGRAGAECPGGIGFANIACNTRENDGEHDQDGRGKGCVLVRGPEQLRDAREGALRLLSLIHI